MNKYVAQKRRGLKTKYIQKAAGKPRLIVFRSGKHTYAQIVESNEKGCVVIAEASTVSSDLKKSLAGTKIERATQVGELLAKRALKNNVKEISFDRNGYKYHGRVKALAESARKGGLVF